MATRTLENAVQTSNEIRESLRDALSKETTEVQRKDLQLAARAMNHLQFASLQPALEVLNRTKADAATESADLQSARDLTTQGLSLIHI